jgi:hypothetical protein
MGLTKCEHRVCDATFEWFETNYHLTRGEIDELEAYLMAHLVDSDGKPSVWDHLKLSLSYNQVGCKPTVLVQAQDKS